MFHTMDREDVCEWMGPGVRGQPSNLLRHLTTIEGAVLERQSEDHARKVRVTHHGPLPSSVVRRPILQEEQRLLLMKSAFALSIDKRNVLRKDARQL